MVLGMSLWSQGSQRQAKKMRKRLVALPSRQARSTGREMVVPGVLHVHRAHVVVSKHVETRGTCGQISKF